MAFAAESKSDKAESPMKRIAGTILLLLLMSAGPTLAGAVEPWEFGLRGGMDARGTVESYVAGEAYLLRDLPWQTGLAGGTLATRLDLGAGILRSDADDGFWLAAGGDLTWMAAAVPVEIEVGFRPVWLSDHEYGDDDFGGGLLFASHIGLALHLRPFVVGYRFQHMSNAGLYAENPGINLHLFGIGAHF